LYIYLRSLKVWSFGKIEPTGMKWMVALCSSSTEWPPTEFNKILLIISKYIRGHTVGKIGNSYILSLAFLFKESKLKIYDIA
jgi:hypothetical protein